MRIHNGNIPMKNDLTKLRHLEQQFGQPSLRLRFKRGLANVLHPLKSRSDHWSKRLLDVATAGTALAVFLPFGLIIALLIRRDGGPVFYWQDRVGYRGRTFRFPKFRSMVTNADQLRRTLLKGNDHAGSGITFKSENDPRITAVGRFLRRSSLDEIPQLWSVLRGDMSLVGPRPALPEEVARYTPLQRRRLEIQPGLTCIWQISGRSQIPFEGQVALDIEYIRSRSFRGDLLLLLKTIPAVLFGRGAS